MKRTEDELAARLASLIDQGARELDPRTAERLADARRQALRRYQAEPATAWSWAAAASGGARYRSESRRYGMRRPLLVAALVAAALAVGVTWNSSRAPDIADIDAALLTDDLPINAFLDQGFDSWLKRGSR